MERPEVQDLGESSAEQDEKDKGRLSVDGPTWGCNTGSCNHFNCLIITWSLIAVMLMFGIGLTTLILVWIFKYNEGFVRWVTEKEMDGIASNTVLNVHVLTAVGCFTFLQGISNIFYRIPNLPISHEVKKYIHFSLHLIVVIFTILSLVAAVRFHDIWNLEHFHSLHSWLGLGAMVLYFGQFLVSTILLPNFYIPFVRLLTNVHRVVGTSVFLITVTAALTGLYWEIIYIKSLGKKKDTDMPFPILNAAGICLVLFSVFQIYLVTRNKNCQHNISCTRSQLLQQS